MSLESLKTLIANDAELGDDLKTILPRVKERLKNEIPYSFYPKMAKAFDRVYGSLFPPPEEDWAGPWPWLAWWGVGVVSGSWKPCDCSFYFFFL